MGHHRLPGNHISASLWLFWHSCLGCLFWLRFLEIIAKFTFCSHNHSSFSFSFLKREPVTSLERSKVLLIKTKLLLHYVWDFWGKEERAAFVNATSQGKTYTNTLPLAKRWIPVGHPLEVLEKALEVLENLLEVLRKAVVKLCAKPLKNPLGKFMQAILGVESKQSFILLL